MTNKKQSNRAVAYLVAAVLLAGLAMTWHQWAPFSLPQLKTVTIWLCILVFAAFIYGIQQLSATTQARAACAKEQILSAKADWFRPLAFARTWVAGYYLKEIIKTQDRLIVKLKAADFCAVDSAWLEQLARDLDRCVDLSLAVTDMGHAAFGLPSSWAERFERIEENTSYIDSIAESLHAAANVEATALIAAALYQTKFETASV